MSARDSRSTGGSTDTWRIVFQGMLVLASVAFLALLALGWTRELSCDLSIVFALVAGFGLLRSFVFFCVGHQLDTCNREDVAYEVGSFLFSMALAVVIVAELKNSTVSRSLAAALFAAAIAMHLKTCLRRMVAGRPAEKDAPVGPDG
jgi:hypothetical protein